MKIKTFDFEANKTSFISIRYKGSLRVVSYDDLIDLLMVREAKLRGIEEIEAGRGMKSTNDAVESFDAMDSSNMASKRSLASIGGMLSPIYRSCEISFRDEEKILDALRNFDGQMSERMTSQVGHMLREMLYLKDLSGEAKKVITRFLEDHPQLELVNKTIRPLKILMAEKNNQK